MNIRDYYKENENNDTVLTITSEESGYDKEQNFYKEDMKFLLLNETEEKYVYISEKPSEQTLYLKGKNGYRNGIELMHKLCKAFNKNARNLTLEDIEESLYLEDDKKKELIFDESETDFWLANRYRYFSDNCMDLGFHFFTRGGLCSDTTIAGVFYFDYTDGAAYEHGGFRVRPVIVVEKEKYDRR